MKAPVSDPDPFLRGISVFAPNVPVTQVAHQLCRLLKPRAGAETRPPEWSVTVNDPDGMTRERFAFLHFINLYLSAGEGRRKYKNLPSGMAFDSLFITG